MVPILRYYNQTAPINMTISSWSGLSFILSLVSNIYILYATICYKAIKIDTLSQWVIKNLAVADICTAILNILPVTVNSIAGNKWALGGTYLCATIAALQPSPVAANSLFINILQINKIYRCVFPLRAFVVKKKRKLQATFLPLLISFYNTVHMGLTYLVNGFINVGYFQNACTCSYSKDTGDSIILKTSQFIFAFSNTGAPCVCLLVTMVILIVVAFRMSSHANKPTIVCFILMTFTFLLSVLPWYLYHMGYLSHNIVPLLGCFLWELHQCSFIYYLTNATFNSFTRALLTCGHRPTAKHSTVIVLTPDSQHAL